jgi:hypothetical protein
LEAEILIIIEVVNSALFSFEAMKQNHNANVSSLQEKLTVLSMKLVDLENGYNSAVQQTKEETAKAQGLEK